MESVIFHNNVGQCLVYVGSMCSGKTTQLNLELTKAADTGMSVLRIGYLGSDNRNTDGGVSEDSQKDGITSHSSQFNSLSSKVKSIKMDHISGIPVDKYQVIGIDEGQFFPDLYTIVKEWVTKYSKIVYISALDGDSNLNLFGEQVTKLLPISTKFKKMTARCIYCLRDKNYVTPAVATARLIKSNSQKLIGGLESYAPVCLNCHTKYNI